MKKIFIGAPVRDRAWILPRFIKHIKKMNTTDIELHTLFLINDCDDNSEDLLRQAGFNTMVVNELPSKTVSSLRGKYSYQHLATLRNILIEEFLKTDNEYFFSIDTDILVPEHGLKKLIENNKDICSMILCNEKGQLGKRAHNIMNYNPKKRKFYHILDWEKNSIFEVDLTGAVYLIHRRVLENGVRYADNTLGEDVPFCQKAKEKGFKIFCDTSIKPIHVMDKDVELVADKIIE